MTGAAKVTKWAGIVTVSAFVLALVSVIPYFILDDITDKVTGLAKYPTALLLMGIVLYGSILVGILSFPVYLVARIVREAQSKSEG